MYEKLKKSHNIDVQISPNVLKQYPIARELNYEAVNNNRSRNRNKLLYDYKIQNPVDFSKLFLNTQMAQYSGFDETCDSAALLNIIMFSDVKSIVGQIADKVSNFILIFLVNFVQLNSSK